MKKEGKKKKTWLYVLIVVLILIIAFLLWWFLRCFDVTFKYNNGDDDYIVKVRYLNVIKKDDVKEDFKKDGYTFAGYFETYYLSGEEIEIVKNDDKKGETICKEGFKLNSEKTKCVSEKEFDFENTRITEKKTIEALWSKPVENNTVKISASANCAIGTNAVTLTAKITGNAKVKEWSVPSCYTDSKVSDKAIKVTRNGNCPNEISSDTVKVTLTNGKTATYTLKYEPKLKVTVYDEDHYAMSESSSNSYGGGSKYVGANINAKFSTSTTGQKLIHVTDKETQWQYRAYDTNITIKTACQSITVNLTGTIN